MLRRHSEQESSLSPTIGADPALGIDPELHVTPQELAAAIEAVERRKAYERERLVARDHVADVVRELGIDATPDEIMDEVRAQRRRTAATPSSSVAQNQAAGQSLGVRRTFKQLFAGLAFAVVVAGATIGSVVGLERLKGYTPPGAPLTETLAQATGSRGVSVDTQNLIKINRGAAPSSVLVTENLNLLDSPWTVQKIGGHYYVWGFLKSRMTQQAVDAAGTVTLYNASEDAKSDLGQPTRVLLRLDQMHIGSTGGKGLRVWVNVDHLTLDSHMYDPWNQ